MNQAKVLDLINKQFLLHGIEKAVLHPLDESKRVITTRSKIPRKFKREDDLWKYSLSIKAGNILNRTIVSIDPIRVEGYGPKKEIFQEICGSTWNCPHSIIYDIWKDAYNILGPSLKEMEDPHPLKNLALEIHHSLSKDFDCAQKTIHNGMREIYSYHPK